MGPIWCASGLAAEPTTRTLDSFGGWTDSFQTNVQMGQLNEGQMGYHVFNSLTAGGAIDPGQLQSMHFVNNNHWMIDMSHNNGGAAISPNQSFRFQNGKLVLEADVAAGIPGYFDSGGDIVWPEIMWSTAPAPTGQVVDGLYLYGEFGGSWASGCRLNGERNLICSLEAPTNLASTTNDTFPCFSEGPSRVFEISWFEQCGNTHYGGSVDAGAPRTAFRACQPNQMDMFCRDRFRLEWTQSGFTAYVNGILFFQDSGWPGYAQIPTSIVNGSTPVYAYFGEWGDFSDSNVYRFHWGRIAVNPHDSAGNLVGLSASPSYCPDMPNLTCSMADPGPMPSPTSMPGSVPSPTAKPSPTSLPSPSPSPVAGPVPPDPSGPFFRGRTSVVNSRTIRRPAGVLAGDVEIAQLEVDHDPVAVTAPDGWKLIADTPAALGTPQALHLISYVHTVGPADPLSYTWKVNPASFVDIGIVAYGGLKGANPVDAAAGSDEGVTSHATAPAVTTTSANDLVIGLFTSFEYCSWSAGSGMTKRYNFDANAAADQVVAASGSSVAASATCSLPGHEAAQTVALRAA